MASMTVPTLDPQPGQVTGVVVGGVDTHKDLHVAAVVDGGATVLGTESFSTTRAGYRALGALNDAFRLRVERFELHDFGG